MKIRRRHVLYVPGLDARGAGFYERIFARNAKAWADRDAIELDVRSDDGAPLTLATDTVTTRIEMLSYERHVREHWPKGWRMAPAYLRAAWRYVRTGSFTRVRRSAGPAALAAIVLPSVVLLSFLIGAVSLFAAIAALIAGASPYWLLLPALLFAFFSLTFGKASPRETVWMASGVVNYVLNEREDLLRADGHIERFAARIAEAMGDPDTDEVLLIGHSYGTRVAVSAAAEVVRRGHPIPHLLTLVPSVTFLSVMPDARWLRDDLATLARHDGLNWVDISSPIDGANAALVDPVREAFGPATTGGARTFSAYLRELYSSASYAKARRSRYETHFMVLGVPETPQPHLLDLFDMLMSDAPALARFDRPEDPGPFYAPLKYRDAAASRGTRSSPG